MLNCVHVAKRFKKTSASSLLASATDKIGSFDFDSSRQVHPADTVEHRDRIFRDIVDWGYFEGQFRRTDKVNRLNLIRQLYAGMTPEELSADIKEALAVTAAKPVKRCPKCSIPFSSVTERFYHCGKYNNPYNIYECAQCKSQNRIGEYSDMERLRPKGCKQFKHLACHPVKLVEWIKKESYGASCWFLEARGQAWTRCNEPTCNALYKYYTGKSRRRTVENHWKRLEK